MAPIIDTLRDVNIRSSSCRSPWPDMANTGKIRNIERDFTNCRSRQFFHSRTVVAFTVDARSKFTIPVAASQPDPLELLPPRAVA